MTTTASSDIYYDPFDVEIRVDPYPLSKRLRDEAPLYCNGQHTMHRGVVER